MRPALVPLLLLALVACQTPREACEAAAGRDLRVIEGLIGEVEGNLARGYAVAVEERVRVRRDICRGTDEDGGLDLDACQDVDVDRVARPVAIDPAAERAKLDALLARREALRARSAERLGACALV